VPDDAGLFRGILETTRAELAGGGQRVHFAAGESLFHQGDLSTTLILIVRGKVKIWRAAADGSSITLTIVGPGEPIGTLHAVERDMPHTATGTAVIATEALCWPIDHVRRLMRDDPALTANVLGVVARYAALMIERLEEVSTIPVERRIARALCRAADNAWSWNDDRAIALSRQDIADLTSATLPTVSRIMARWRVEGLIAGGRGHVRILKADALRALAGRTPDQGM